MKPQRRTVLLIFFLPMLGLLVSAMVLTYMILITGQVQPWAMIGTSLGSASIVWSVGWWWVLRKHDGVLT